jgi:hypothetical protein
VIYCTLKSPPFGRFSRQKPYRGIFCIGGSADKPMQKHVADLRRRARANPAIYAGGRGRGADTACEGGGDLLVQPSPPRDRAHVVPGW